MNYLKLLWELYSLKCNEKKSFEQIKAQQEKALRKILIFAYEQSGYYHKSFTAAGINKDNIATMPLCKFPTLSKSELLMHFDELVTVDDLTQEEMREFDAKETTDRKAFKGKYHIVHSSGSTGTPGYFVYDKAAWGSMLLGIIRGALWQLSMPQILKLLAKGPRIAYLAATDGRYGGAMAVGDGIEGVHASSMFLDIKTPLAQWISQICKFKPNMIIGYPSAIKILAELVQSGEVKLNIIRVISCGEPLGSSLRNYLEKTFSTQIVNFYGASESLSLGVELDPKEGMVLFDDMNVIESVDGQMYLTCTYNFAQPLIRYKITDQLTLQGPDKNSRYPFSRAIGLLGRNEDVLWFSDENGNREFLHPLAIEGFCIDGLLDFQFRQTSENTFEMLAQASKTASKEKIECEMLAQMRDVLKEKELDYVEFSINFVDEILPDQHTGKKRLIINKYDEKRVNI